MKQPRTARGGEAPLRTIRPDTTVPRGKCAHESPAARDHSDATSGLTVSAIDRLIARIETGTATPEDIDGLPEGVVEYLHAALALNEMGVLGADWEVTPTGGILVRGTAT